MPLENEALTDGEEPQAAAPAGAGLSMEEDLRAALDAGLFRIHWQPIVTCSSGELLGFEALVRWDRPGHGKVSPGVFVPIIERMGLFRKFDTWILNQAAAAASRWPSHLPSTSPPAGSTAPA